MLTADDSTLTDNGIWNDQASSLRVTGPCQWILYVDSNYAGSSSVVGPGTRDYEFGSGANGFGLAMMHSLLYAASQQMAPREWFSFNMIFIVAELLFFLPLLQTLQMKALMMT